MAPTEDDRSVRHTLSLRISDELLRAVDLEVTRLQAQRPGAHIQRSDVIREALGRQLLPGDDRPSRATPPDANPSSSAPPDPDPALSDPDLGGGVELGPASSLRPLGGRGSPFTRWAWSQESEDDASDPDRRQGLAHTLRRAIQVVYVRAADARRRVHPPLADGGTHALLSERCLGTFAAGDNRIWFARILLEGPAAILTAAANFVERGGLRRDDRNPISLIGDLVSTALRRQLLLLALEDNQWNLAQTAAELRMGAGASPVLRLIRDLGLEEEHAQARRDGFVRTGRPPADPKKKQ